MQLTASQVQQLRPYFERAASTNQIGEPGMLVAQLRFDRESGEGTMEPGFLRHEYAKLLEERGERYAIAPPESVHDVRDGQESTNWLIIQRRRKALKIGDRVRFKPLNDTGVIVGREKRYFNRPWMVRWDASGVVTSPIGKSIEPALPETVEASQSDG